MRMIYERNVPQIVDLYYDEYILNRTRNKSSWNVLIHTCVYVLIDYLERVKRTYFQFISVPLYIYITRKNIQKSEEKRVKIQRRSVLKKGNYTCERYYIVFSLAISH